MMIVILLESINMKNASKISRCLDQVEKEKHLHFLACLGYIIREGKGGKFNIGPPNAAKFDDGDHTELFFTDLESLAKTFNFPVLSVLIDLLAYYDPDSAQMKVPGNFYDATVFANEWGFKYEMI